MSVLDRLTREGSQILCATHSPVLAALPGAKILEVGEWGMRESTWEELELVQHWNAYLGAPGHAMTAGPLPAATPARGRV